MSAKRTKNRAKPEKKNRSAEGGEKRGGLKNRAEGAKKEINEVSVSAIPPKAELSQNRKIFSPIKRKNGGRKSKMKRKFFCFGYRRACEAGGNANRKLSVGITPRAERANKTNACEASDKLVKILVGILFKISSDFVQNTPHNKEG